MLKSATVLAAAAALSCGITSPAGASVTDAPPGQVQLDLKSINGSGCKRGTANAVMNQSNTAFTVTYSDFTAEAGPDSEPIKKRRNCQLGINVHVPQGFTVAISRSDFRGYADLRDGASGTFRTSYYIQGEAGTVHVDEDFYGPYEDNWQVSRETAWADLVWGKCGRSTLFNVNQQLMVRAGDYASDSSFLTMDSTDHSAETVFNVSWRRC